MRESIASYILCNQTMFDIKELDGKSCEEYAVWLTGSSSAWGGDPEF